MAYGFDQSNSAVNASAVSTLSAITNATTLQISITGGTNFTLGEIKAASSGTERMGQIMEAINRKSADTGVTAFLTQNDTGTYRIDLMSSKLDSAGDATVVTTIGFTLATTGIAAGALASNINATNTTTDALGIDTLTIDTQRNAWVAIKKIDAAINQVNNARADLGALQSRFDSTVSNIDIQVENIAASRGRIVDADFAKETANLSRTQILQQAGTAMVAQANQLPQGVLALLR